MPDFARSLRRFARTLALAAALIAPVAAAQDNAPTPTEAEEVRRLGETYLGHLDRGEYDRAHAMFSADMRRMAPLPAWRETTQATRAEWGALAGREQVRITAYRDPKDAPRPGLYIAVDYVSRYANLAQHTQYLVWHREREGDAFALIRHETNAVEKQAAARGAPLPGAEPGRIPYPNIETARAALLARDDVRQREENGWLILTVPSEYAIWSFTPAGHPAHPSMVLRMPVQRDGEILLSLDVMCGADKPACDALTEEFRALNARMSEQMRRGTDKGRNP
jgi:hypothetical protein